MAPGFDLALARLNLARSLAWGLLLGGWIGLASLAALLAPGPLAGYGLVALWLLALGAFATLLGRLPLKPAASRVLLIVCAALAARGLFAAVQGSGLAALVPALLAWALLTALASASVRALRAAAPRRPGPPIAAGAAGALIAWAVVGDAGDVAALAPRLSALLLLAATLLAALHPGGDRVASRPGCRAGLFDCSLPAWPAGGWRTPQRWPVLLAALVMLPMMCSLPQMLALCRSASVAPQAVLGAHLAAMFVPALLLRGVARNAPGATGWTCAALLAAGGGAAWLAGAAAWWWLAFAHGTAWSLAWAAQLEQAELRAGANASPLRVAAVHALFALLLGAAVAVAGLQAVFGLQMGLATAAALVVCVLAWRSLARRRPAAVALGRGR